MAELIYLNGKVLPLADATIGVEDRGFQFADGVYEVIRLYDGQPFTLAEHLQRLERSAAGIELKLPMPVSELASAIRGVVDQSGIVSGMVYVQLTRGCCPRNHVWDDQTPPTLLFYVRELPPPVTDLSAIPGIRLITLSDDRWSRCWIKSIALLPNVLAKNAAHRAGADEAVFVHNGIVTECCSTNLFAVINGQVWTHPVGPKVLPGITRAILLDMEQHVGIEILERPFTEQQAAQADELFITSTTREINWVSHWNNRPIATTPGPITRQLHQQLRTRILAETRASSR